MIMNSLNIVFFSGTGCTALCAETLKRSLEELGATVSIDELREEGQWPLHISAEMLVIMFPVHSFDAPLPIFEYLEKLEPAKGIPAAILAVSGGGEVVSNRACNLATRRGLEKKGYPVVYEAMFVMPCNTMVATPRLAGTALLKKLPAKADEIARDIIAGIERRFDPPLIDRLCARLGKYERKYQYREKFSQRIQVGETCSSCGLCARSCPRDNIEMDGGTPCFKTNCAICLKCIYGCPRQALTAGYGSSLVLKGGFALSSFANEAYPNADEIEPLLKGFIWHGVRGYLNS